MHVYDCRFFFHSSDKHVDVYRDNTRDSATIASLDVTDPDGLDLDTIVYTVGSLQPSYIYNSLLFNVNVRGNIGKDGLAFVFAVIYIPLTSYRPEEPSYSKENVYYEMVLLIRPT